MSEFPFLFTWAAQREIQPVALAGGKGAEFVTQDGETWLDFTSLSYQANLGHGETRVIEAIKGQADFLCLSTPNAIFPAKTELAKKLLALTPAGYGRVFFTNGGAEAVENALKIARIITKRYKTISRYRSYHGATMGAVSVTGDWRRPPVEPGVPGAVHALDCYCDRCPFGQTLTSCARECATHIEQLLALEGPSTVAAVILETIPGANGVLVPPSEYWPMIRSACNAHGTLLIADEVLTGFGRTGKTFAFEHFEVIPDMIVVAKGLTGGYAPLGALLISDQLAAHFDELVLPCGLTNYAHPLSCAAANAALDVYTQDALFTKAAISEESFLNGLAQLRARFPTFVRYTRGIGLLGALELAATKEQWQKLEGSLQVQKLAVHMYPERDTIVLAPPLVITSEQIQQGMSRLACAIESARDGA